MVATSGSVLLPTPAVDAYLTHLLPHTTLLTPNLPEALLLAELAGRDFGKLQSLGLTERYDLAFFLASKVEWVLLKGGHLGYDLNGKKMVFDILVNSKGLSWQFTSDFSDSKNTHGTGCTLACMPSNLHRSSILHFLSFSCNCVQYCFGI